MGTEPRWPFGRSFPSWYAQGIQLGCVPRSGENDQSFLATNIPNCTPKYTWITEGISGCQFRSLEYIYIYILGKFNISLTWIKAIRGWFPLFTMIIVRSQWGRYNLPMPIYIYYVYVSCSPATRFGHVQWPKKNRRKLIVPIAIETSHFYMTCFPWLRGSSHCGFYLSASYDPRIEDFKIYTGSWFQPINDGD